MRCLMRSVLMESARTPRLSRSERPLRRYRRTVTTRLDSRQWGQPPQLTLSRSPAARLPDSHFQRQVPAQICTTVGKRSSRDVERCWHRISSCEDCKTEGRVEALGTEPSFDAERANPTIDVDRPYAPHARLKEPAAESL